MGLVELGSLHTLDAVEKRRLRCDQVSIRVLSVANFKTKLDIRLTVDTVVQISPNKVRIEKG